MNHASEGPGRASAIIQPWCANVAEAWTLFWSEHQRTSRCLARSPEMCEQLDAHWKRFASTLAPSAKVIDLGCGSGAVGQAMRSAEPGLHVTGIDIARLPPFFGTGLDLRGGVRMESLPFPDGSFVAAVSQFGYEYANTKEAAREIARVLAPGAPLSLLVHHEQGPILGSLKRHRRVIEGICGVRVQAAFFAGDAGVLAERIAVLKREYSNDAVLQAAERELQTHIGRDETTRLQVWRTFVEVLMPELIMLDSLELCCVEGHTIRDVVEPLTEAFEMRPPQPLRTAAGEPIAWIAEGIRRE